MQCLLVDDFFFDLDFLKVWSDFCDVSISCELLGVTSPVLRPEEGVSGTS